MFVGIGEIRGCVISSLDADCRIFTQPEPQGLQSTVADVIDRA